VKQRSCKESGFVLVLSCIVLGVFLTLTAVALDLGNMYLWRLRLERSARAATLSGLGYRVLQGWQSVYGGRPVYTGGGALDSGPPTGNRATAEWTNLRNHVRDATRQNFSAFFADPTDALEARQRVRFVDDGGNTLNVGVGSNGGMDWYNAAEDSIEVRVEYSVPTFLVGRVRFLGIGLGCSGRQAGTCTVGTTQRAQLKPATIAMILDTSGSMVCNAGDVACACRTAPGGCGQLGTTRLITFLKRSAIAFQSFFNPVRDRIAIVPFNLAARVARPIRRPVCGTAIDVVRPFGDTEGSYREFIATILGGWPNDWTQLTTEADFLNVSPVTAECTPTVVTGLEPMSNTNACDGLIQAGVELSRVSAFDAAAGNQSAISTVFFTDGAPNAMRGTFQVIETTRARNPRVGGPVVPVTENDWYQYTIEWRDAGGNITRGPGPLVHAASAAGRLFNFPIGDPINNNVDTQHTTPRDAMICGDIRSNPNDFGQVNMFTGGPVACLTSTAFSLPGLPGATVRGVPHFNNYGAQRLWNYDHLHYFCAIAAADWIRQVLGVTIYTVGLGSPAAWCGDPTQDADNHFSRKDYFLARLAYTRNSTNEVADAWSPMYDFSPRGPRTISSAGQCAQHSFNVGGFSSGGNVPMQFGYLVANAQGVLQTALPPGNPFAAPPGVPPPGTPILPPGDPNALRGQYFGTDTPDELPLLFTRIAKQILLRQDS
jgi:hypothetical protein